MADPPGLQMQLYSGLPLPRIWGTDTGTGILIDGTRARPVLRAIQVAAVFWWPGAMANRVAPWAWQMLPQLSNEVADKVVPVTVVRLAHPWKLALLGYRYVTVAPTMPTGEPRPRVLRRLTTVV